MLVVCIWIIVVGCGLFVFGCAARFVSFVFVVLCFLCCWVFRLVLGCGGCDFGCVLLCLVWRRALLQLVCGGDFIYVDLRFLFALIACCMLLILCGLFGYLGL